MSAYVPVPQVGRGTTLSWTPTGGSITTFLSLVSVKPSAPTVGEVETTLIGGVAEDYLPTIPGAEGLFKIQHWDNDPGCVAMQAACNTAPVPIGVFLITLPSGATLSIPGFPKSYEIDEVQNKEIITATVNYRQKGVRTYTPAPDPS